MQPRDAWATTIIDLTHPLHSGLPAFEPHGAPIVTEVPHLLSGTRFTIGLIGMSAHTGTHVDAPSHLLPGARTLSDFPIARFFGSAYVADFTDRSLVTVDDLRSLPADCSPGDSVFFWFGRAGMYGTPEYRIDHPYLAADAADWLVARGTPFIGMDAPTPDMPVNLRGVEYDFPVHRTLLGGECLIIENLGPGLETLVGRRVDFCALPLALADLDGSPIRAAAWDPRSGEIPR